MVVIDDPDLHCVPGICKRKHKSKRYRDGHKFGRKYAISTLSGDNNGNGPSKNLSSVRFGLDIGGIQYEDGDFGTPDYGSISNSDHTNVHDHENAIYDRRNRGPLQGTSVRNEKTSRIKQTTRNDSEQVSSKTERYVDFANIRAKEYNEEAESGDDDEHEDFSFDEILMAKGGIEITPSNLSKIKGKLPFVSPERGYYSMPTQAYPAGEGSSNNPFPSGLRNSIPIQGENVSENIPSGLMDAFNRAVSPYIINPLEGRGGEVLNSVKKAVRKLSARVPKMPNPTLRRSTRIRNKN